MNVSQGSVATQLRCDGIFNYALLQIFHTMYRWMNFKNRSVFVKVTAKDKVGHFLRHSVWYKLGPTQTSQFKREVGIILSYAILCPAHLVSHFHVCHFQSTPITITILSRFFLDHALWYLTVQHQTLGLREVASLCPRNRDSWRVLSDQTRCVQVTAIKERSQSQVKWNMQ